ncbi:BTB/POZ/Kelch-associated protein [Euphorbia peplus]|nr:BTB/POZ/Kelch-associated protein [Euphorbia peplus]
MEKKHGCSPFMFPSTARSGASESTPPSSSPPPSPCSSGSDSSFNSPYKSSTLSTLSLPTHSSSSHFHPPAVLGPCAACKFHGRDCSEKCYLASFFPRNDVHKFDAVASVFGSGNVHNFLQTQNNSSYIPLLVLLRDTTLEDGELHSDSKKNTVSETDIHNELGASMDSDDIRELIQGRELTEQLNKHLSSELSEIITEQLVQRILSSFDKSLLIPNLSCSTSQLQNDAALAVPNPATVNFDKSPICMDDSPATVNFDSVLNPAAKRRKTCTYEIRISSEPSLVDDGYNWRKYGQKDILGSKFPRSYYRCIYRHSLGCMALKKIQRCVEDPSTFEITYGGLHTCSNGNQQPQLQPQASPFNFQPSTNFIEIFPMQYVSDSAIWDTWQDPNEALRDAAKQSLAARDKDISKFQEEVLKLSLAGFEEVLSSDDLQVAAEDTVHDIVLKWARVHYPKVEERREILASRLGRLIRFPFMTCRKLKKALVCDDFDSEFASKFVLEALFFKGETLYRQRFLAAEASTNGRFVERDYIYRPVKVVEFELPRQQCIAYLDLKREKCAHLFPAGRVYSQAFHVGGQGFFLSAHCNMDQQSSSCCFGLFLGMQEKGSVSFAVVDYEFAARSKPTEEYVSKYKGNYTFTGGKAVGYRNLFGIPWTAFMADDSLYFINGILHLRAELTIRQSS